MLRFERMFYVACIVILIFSFVHHQSSKASLLTGFEEGFTGVAEKVAPVVVNISAEGTVNQSPVANPFQGTPFEDFFHQFSSPQFKQHFTSLGSGVIVRKNGYILTNAHVIRNASKISVILSNGTTFRNAKLIGTDPRVDLAVIKIDSKNPLPEGLLGDSDKIKVGSWAIAVGNPYGFKSTVTVGVVSAKGRNLPGESQATYHNLIQTDASINPGNSGGPLVNINGEIIGINTSIATPTGGSVGIGFAIPINTAKSELDALITQGKVVHGYLGVYTQPMTPELLKAFGVTTGVLVADIIQNSPAAKAGLQRGDVILKYNEKKIETPEDLQDTVNQTPVKSIVHVQVKRGKEILTFNATIKEIPSLEQGEKTATAYWGLHLKEITPALAQTYNLHGSTGLLVTQVDPDSLAAMAQVVPGDVILEVDRQPVGNLEQLKKSIEDSLSNTVLLLVQHQGTLRYVALNKK